MVRDGSTGVDLGPLAAAVAATDGVPLDLLLACAWAESTVRSKAERWGSPPEGWTSAAWLAYIQGLIERRDYTTLQGIVERAWPDISFGCMQPIVATARGYGIGDDSKDVANVLSVRTALFDPTICLDVGARILSGCLTRQDVQESRDPDLAALIVYNAGYLPDEGDPWWGNWAANVARYSEALAWARDLVKE